MTVITDPSKIEKELEKQFSEKGIVNRYALFNLIVYASNKDRAEYIKGLLSKLTDKFPARIVFIIINGNQARFEVHADVKNKVPCDWIEISLSEGEQEKAPFLILPLLIPDIPIFALWGEDPTIENKILPTIYPYINRLVFDSVCVHNIKNFAKRLLEKHDSKIRDVNWTALSGWRNVFTRTIDTKEELGALANSTSVEIKYNDQVAAGLPHPEIQALYFKAWLESKIHFKNSNIIKLSGQKSPIGRAGDILSVMIDGPNGTHIHFDRKDLNCITHVEFESFCQMPQNMPLGSIQRGFRFWREIFFEGISPDYFQMLSRLSQ
jgi:hypothetical protein